MKRTALIEHHSGADSRGSPGRGATTRGLDRPHETLQRSQAATAQESG